MEDVRLETASSDMKRTAKFDESLAKPHAQPLHPAQGIVNSKQSTAEHVTELCSKL